jgi:hypothetical protein
MMRQAKVLNKRRRFMGNPVPGGTMIAHAEIFGNAQSVV